VHGDFSALEFWFERNDVFERVLVFFADGTIEPSLPPPGVPGAVATLARYFECETGLTEALRFTDIELPKKTSNDYLKLEGTMSNFDSLVTDKLKIYVIRPENNVMDVQFTYKLKATRDICIDQTRHETDEEFRIVQLDTRFVSAGNHLSDTARYTKNVDVDCDFFGDCDLDKIRVCSELENVTGYLFDDPNTLDDRHVELFHSTDAPAETPTLDVVMFSPSPSDVKPQGFVTASADPEALNASLWADWVEVNKDYDVGKTVGSFNFVIEAQDPDEPGCDRFED
jgi:hypothetical protein